MTTLDAEKYKALYNFILLSWAENIDSQCFSEEPIVFNFEYWKRLAVQHAISNNDEIVVFTKCCFVMWLFLYFETTLSYIVFFKRQCICYLTQRHHSKYVEKLVHGRKSNPGVLRHQTQVFWGSGNMHEPLHQLSFPKGSILSTWPCASCLQSA